MSVAVRRGIDAVLATARAGLDRITPCEAFEAARTGAVLVDIRPELNRRIEGELVDALIIERNVLEWRLDPASDARLPIADYDLHVIVVCNEGYTSSLAAAALQDLGMYRATDLIGGFRAWRQLAYRSRSFLTAHERREASHVSQGPLAHSDDR